MPANNRRLADAVRRWVTERSLSQARIAAAGGPSSTSMTKVTSGEGNLQPSLLGRIDEGLGWGEGVAAGILAGGPTPWDSTPAEFDWRTVSNDELLAVLRDRLEGGRTDGGMLEAQKTLRNALDLAAGGRDPKLMEPDE